MSIIDDIKRDREAGTPGCWFNDVDGFGSNRVGAFGFDTYDGTEILAQVRSAGCVTHIQASANARRIARVPDMEAALIAAEELAEVLAEYSKYTDWFPQKAYDALSAYRKATETPK